MLWFIFACFLSYCLVQADELDSSHIDYNNTDLFFQFVTRQDIGAPRWDIEIYDQDAVEPGMYWFVSPYASLEQKDYPLWNGPHIYDSTGELIWSGAPYVKYTNAFDFRMSKVDGQQMLSFVYPKRDREGNGFILNSAYEVHTVVDMVGNHSKWNMHEFNLIDNGEKALMAFPQDYSATPIHVPGFNGTCRVGWQGFKEVEVKTGEVNFEWNTQGHVTVEESNYVAKTVSNNTWKYKCSSPWDITHINAVDKFTDGDYLFSARHTDTLYKVSHTNRSIVWRLGGPDSDFVFKDQRAKFTRQHHARFRGQNETHTMLSVFDNAVGSGNLESESSSASWGLHILLRHDVTPMTAELIARFEKPRLDNDADYSRSRGSVSFLPNGNAFIGWVRGSHISEHAPDGRLLMTAMMRTPKASSYRSYKFPWFGMPAQPPDVVAAAINRNSGNEDLMTNVHVSWNGATEVATWNVLHSNYDGTVTALVASSPRQGFETKLTVDGFAKHVIVVALDISGREIGRSKVVTASLPPDLQSPSLAHTESVWINNHTSSWWEAPFAGASTWGKFEWFIIGFVCCVVIGCVGVGLWLRKRVTQQGPLWWRSRQPEFSSYRSVADSEEDEMEQKSWMLDDKEVDELDDEVTEEMGYSKPYKDET